MRVTSAQSSSALRRYRQAMGIAEPLAAPLIWLAHGRNRGSWRDRTGRSAPSSPPEPLVWMHGASLGETLAMLPLVKEMKRQGVHSLITCQTATAATLLSKRLAGDAEVRFAPFDFPKGVRRFLAAWRPRLLVLMEGEVWPVLMDAAASAGLPVSTINPRMSERSHRRWLRLESFAKEVFGSISLALGADDKSRDRLISLGVRPDGFECAASLKQAGYPPPVDAETLKVLRRRIGDAPVWLAACTHPADEEVAVEAQSLLAQTATPPPLLILVPRHPERGAATLANAARAGLRGVLRSNGEEPGGGEDVYVADTVGEMGLWYSLAPVSFVGGSFGEEGGHNPLEAVRLDSAVLHGPSVDSFQDIYADLGTVGGAVSVGDGAELARNVERLLSDGCAMDLAQAARTTVESQEAEVERMARRLMKAAGLRVEGEGM